LELRRKVLGLCGETALLKAFIGALPNAVNITQFEHRCIEGKILEQSLQVGNAVPLLMGECNAASLYALVKHPPFADPAPSTAQQGTLKRTL
jgi:hypothetical protein